jgi:hypothetical protein
MKNEGILPNVTMSVSAVGSTFLPMVFGVQSTNYNEQIVKMSPFHLKYIMNARRFSPLTHRQTQGQKRKYIETESLKTTGVPNDQP